MKERIMEDTPSDSDARTQVALLYKMLIDAWNMRDAAFFASQFTNDGNTVGFDGSQIDGRDEIESAIAKIFQNHSTASYVSIVREIRELSPDVALLRAVAGMVPRGESDINPNVNAIQSLVAVRNTDRWRIALFQNTPAQFHGRPELSESLSSELREAIKKENQNEPNSD